MDGSPIATSSVAAKATASVPTSTNCVEATHSHSPELLPPVTGDQRPVHHIVGAIPVWRPRPCAGRSEIDTVRRVVGPPADENTITGDDGDACDSLLAR